jgi:hypothetical protein
MHFGLWTRPNAMPSLIRLSRFQSAPGEAHFKALQTVLLFFRENPERCLMYRRPSSMITQMHVNLEGHANQVSAVSADFDITGSVCAVIDSAVAMSPEPPEIELAFPTVDMPSIASIVRATDSSSKSDDITTTKSSSPVVGFDPPPTKGSMRQLASQALSLQYSELPFGGSARNRPPSPTALRSLNYKPRLKSPNSSNDVGLPYKTAIIVGEDNEAACQIGHVGKVTHNVRHVVIQTAWLYSKISLP